MCSCEYVCLCVYISLSSQLKQKFSQGSFETNSNLIHIEKHMTGYLQKHILVKNDSYQNIYASSTVSCCTGLLVFWDS